MYGLNLLSGDDRWRVEMVPHQKLNFRRTLVVTGNGDGLRLGNPVGEPG